MKTQSYYVPFTVESLMSKLGQLPGHYRVVVEVVPDPAIALTKEGCDKLPPLMPIALDVVKVRAGSDCGSLNPVAKIEASVVH